MPNRRFHHMILLALFLIGSSSGARARQPDAGRDQRPIPGAAGVAGQRALPPGVIVAPTSGLITVEGGSAATFTVSLASPPTADVSIYLYSSDSTEGTVAPGQMIFTPANWHISQTATVYSPIDLELDGDVAYTIVTTASSADPGYDGIAVPDVSAISIDTSRSVAVGGNGQFTTEAGGVAHIKVALTYVPTADVIIDLVSSDPSEGTVSPARLTFTPANWTTIKGVIVTGVADDLADGDVAYTIVTTASSADPGYDGIAVADVSLTNLDVPPSATRVFLPLLRR